MSNREYAALPKRTKKPHTVSYKELKDFEPKFIVASDYPKRLQGFVELWSDFTLEPLSEWTDTSRVRYEVSSAVDNTDGKYWKDVFTCYDINEAIDFYNDL